MATLAEKTFAAVSGEETPDRIVYEVKELPKEAAGEKEIDDLDLHEWFISFGIAYALSRVEEPFGSEDGWQSAARDAATKASRWCRTIGGRPEGES